MWQDERPGSLTHHAPSLCHLCILPGMCIMRDRGCEFTLPSSPKSLMWPHDEAWVTVFVGKSGMKSPSPELVHMSTWNFTQRDILNAFLIYGRDALTPLTSESRAHFCANSISKISESGKLLSFSFPKMNSRKVYNILLTVKQKQFYYFFITFDSVAIFEFICLFKYLLVQVCWNDHFLLFNINFVHPHTFLIIYI